MDNCKKNVCIPGPVLIHAHAPGLGLVAAVTALILVAVAGKLDSKHLGLVYALKSDLFPFYLMSNIVWALWLRFFSPIQEPPQITFLQPPQEQVCIFL